MTFKIVDGREYFYQWDTNRQIIVDDPTISEVHFCNRLDNCSLVVEVVNGIANVPNILLQKSFDIKVFAYDGEATLFDRVFEVKARTQPSDYVYTETEIRRYSDLEQRIDEIERNGISEEAINNAVNKFLEENPVDMAGYATEEYVNEAVSNVSVDLSGYAKESYVDSAITQSVSGLAKKEDIPDVSKFISEIPSEYVTESELNAKGYLTQHQDISGKADVNHTHTGYAKSVHTHDMADVDGLQLAIASRATQEDIGKAIELHNHNDLYAAKEHNHDDKYAIRGHVHSYNDLTNKPEIPSVEGLASEAYVDAAIANIEFPDNTEVFELDIVGGSGYTNLTNEVATKIAANPNKYIIKASWTYKDIKDVYYTFSKLAHSDAVSDGSLSFPATDSIYYSAITETGLSTSPEITASTLRFYIEYQSDNTTVSSGNVYITSKVLNSGSGENVDLSNYYTKSEVDATLNNYYTKEEAEAAIQSALNAIGVAEGGAY